MVLPMRLEDLGLIGNCQLSALIERTGAIVWCCLPRFDSEPVFSTLLDAHEGGQFLVGPAGRGYLGAAQPPQDADLLEPDVLVSRGPHGERGRKVLAGSGVLAAGGRRLWGNFPQAYSHVGLIHAAFAASPRWSEVL